MSTHDLIADNFRFTDSASDVQSVDVRCEAGKYDLISFLAASQVLDVHFIPLVWDVGRGVVGNGATSRIQQSLININTTFTFKVYHKQGLSEERIFRNLITEMTVLREPFLWEHPNVSPLLAVCWDISDHDNKPWPVLVFEKSHLGDLYHFVQHKGKNMPAEERLVLCSNIGRAITDMHSYRKLFTSHSMLSYRTKVENPPADEGPSSKISSTVT